MSNLKPSWSYFQDDNELGIVELSLECPSQIESSPFDLLAELRFGPVDVGKEDGSFSICFGVREALLELKLTGCKFVLGSRSAEADHSEGQKESITYRRQAEISREGQLGAGAKIGVSSVEGSLGGGGSANSKITRTELIEGSYAKQQRHVTALPRGRWRIRALTDSHLEGRYVRPETSLCALEALDADFQVTGSVKFSVESRNIVLLHATGLNPKTTLKQIIPSMSRRGKERTMKEKAIKLVISKALRQEGHNVIAFESWLSYSLDEVKG